MKVDDLANIRMHPITLKFSSDLERNFLSYYNLRCLKQVRFALFICACLSWIYMLVDGQLFPSVKYIESFLTNYLLLPAVFIAYIITYNSNAIRQLQVIIFAIVIIRNIQTVVIMYSDINIVNYYITGLLLSMVYGFSVCRLRFIYATVMMFSVIIVFYISLVLPFSGHNTPTSLINNMIDISLCIILGLFTSYSMERYARRDFIQNLIIQRERQNAADIKLTLERERVSRELHDGISSEFTGIIGFAENIKLKTEQNNPCNKLQETICQIENSARRGLQELRNIMLAIDPETKTLGYVVAYMKRYSHDLLASRGITVEVAEDLRPSADIDLPPQIILALFRITQEACHNILKHAEADVVQLAFIRKSSRIEVEVTDNGGGFSADAVAYGNGISNMRKRAEKVGGQFTITSAPGAGTSILAKLPLS